MAPRLALITGASSGLGAAFARTLAQRKIDLILVARRIEPMERLAAELRTLHGISVHVEPMDLSVPGSATNLHQQLRQQGLVPDILVNNAAFGLAGRFIDHDRARLAEMLQLDIVSLVELTHVFGREMALGNGGNILLVASLAAYQPDPLLAAYGAAKAFVLSFGEALHVELAPKVGVTVVSPGLMETEFLEIADFRPSGALKHGVMSVATVAEQGIQAMLSGRPSVVVGALNRLSALSVKFLPRSWVARVAYKLTKG